MERVIEESISTADIANMPERRDMPDRRDQTSSPQQDGAGPLLPQDVVQSFRSRWDNIQTSFVDEPRSAVQQADQLVAEAIKHLAETFAKARGGMEEQWDRGDNVSTEDLRVALKKYRTFFQRLLAI